MREELSKLNNQRLTFIAVFDRYGTKKNYHGYPQPTICFKDVFFTNGNKATDHIWFTVGKRLDGLGDLNNGDKVCFQARITTYVKGYFKDCQSIDYKLSNPTKIRKITKVV